MPSRSLAFARRRDRRVLLGVAGGFADQHGVDVVVVRAALVVLSFAGGLGIVLYVLGHLLTETQTADLAPAQAPDQRRNLSVAAIALGAALIMRGTGLWLGDAVMATIIIVTSGVTLLAVFRPETVVVAGGRVTDVSPLAAVVRGRHAKQRVIAGAGLIAIGLVLVGGGGGVSAGLRIGVYATALTILGVSVLLGPWLARAAQEVAEERRQRIRLDERDAMAAHLHDSVLQTLALIQRSAGDPRRTVTLARRQEAELREWLYGRAADPAAMLSGAVQAMAHEVEDLYDIRIEVVVVGDGAMTTDLVAVIAAVREACVNAAKHSGVDDVSVFVELRTDIVEAFVRDRGVGFDRASVSGDGRGIRQSIEARIERIGGRTSIESSPGSGTEVRLSVPVAHDVAARGEAARP